MNKINLNNYEAYMLDFLEGHLSAEDTEALMAFSLLHPELELNFDEDLVTLESDNFVFESKQNLKAGFSDELVIGYLENVLSAKEKRDAEILAANNTIFKHELALYKQTIVLADTSIVFENKERLKRRTVIIFFLQNNFVRIAAALLLLFGLWFMVSRSIKNDVKTSPQMAVKEKEIPAMNTNTVSVKKDKVVKENVVVKEEKKLLAKKEKINNSILKKEKQVNTQTVNLSVPDKKEPEPQLVNENKKEEKLNETPDSVKVANAFNKEQLMPKYIIEESADDEPVAVREKSKLWKLTAGLLKRLNRRGVENVNSSDETNEMIIGALTISKPN